MIPKKFYLGVIYPYLVCIVKLGLCTKYKRIQVRVQLLIIIMAKGQAWETAAP